MRGGAGCALALPSSHPPHILFCVASYKVGLHCVIIGLSFSDAGGRPVPPVANSFSQLF